MVQVTISNNIRIRGLTNTKIKADITAALTIPNPEYQKRRKLGKPTWGVDPKIQLYFYDQGDLIIPRGFEEQLFGLLPSPDVLRKDLQEGKAVDFGEWNPSFPMRPYQDEALAYLYKNGILEAPAGSGKTNIALKYIYDHKRPALWLTHTAELMQQTKERAESLIGNIGEIGVIGDGKVKYGSGKLIIAMVQTLQERPALIEALKPLIGTLVIDEAHHLPAFTFSDVINRFNTKNMLGVTATPDRKDQLEALMYFGVGPLLHKAPRQALYDNDQLLKPVVKFVFTQFDYEPASILNKDLCNVDAGGDDLDYRDLLQHLYQDEARLELVVKNIADTCEGNYSLVISESIRMCYKIKDALKHGIHGNWTHRPRIEVIHGPLSRYTWRKASSRFDAENQVKQGKALKWEQKGKGYRVYVEQYTENELKCWNITAEGRRNIMDAAKKRQIDILIVTQLGKEGLDLCQLNVGHLVTPLKGDSQGREDGGALLQYIGRLQRVDPLNPNKIPVLYDYVDKKSGVFYAQYLSRRKSYKRIGITLPKAPKTKLEELDDFLGGISFDSKMFTL